MVHQEVNQAALVSATTAPLEVLTSVVTSLARAGLVVRLHGLGDGLSLEVAAR
jgi:hypothetical protein